MLVDRQPLCGYIASRSRLKPVKRFLSIPKIYVSETGSVQNHLEKLSLGHDLPWKFLWSLNPLRMGLT